MGSGWKIISLDKFVIDIFETRPLRGSSYNETPEKNLKSRCELTHIKHKDEECFTWCMKYHQPDKAKNTDRGTKKAR